MLYNIFPQISMESIIFPKPRFFLKTDFLAGYIILHIYIYTHPIKRRISPLNLHHHLSWGFHPPTPLCGTQEKCTCTLSPTDSVPSAEDKYRAEVARRPELLMELVVGMGISPPNARRIHVFRNLSGASNLPRYIQMKGVFQRILQPVVRSGCAQKRFECYFHSDFWGDDPI